MDNKTLFNQFYLYITTFVIFIFKHKGTLHVVQEQIHEPEHTMNYLSFPVCQFLLFFIFSPNHHDFKINMEPGILYSPASGSTYPV